MSRNIRLLTPARLAIACGLILLGAGLSSAQDVEQLYQKGVTEYNNVQMEDACETLKQVENLKPGDISPVVHTDFGYHILKLEEHEKPGLQPLSQETTDKIRDKLSTDAAKGRFQSWVENDLVKEHHVETFY